MRRDLPHRFEGDAVLAERLARAGCALTVDEVRAEFEAALEEDPDAVPGEILPLLFETEPRFPGPDDAARLYANLLGLWDEVAKRQSGSLPVIQGAAPAPPEPEPGAAEGPEVPAAYVAAAARALVEGDAKARRRAEDRLENRQGVLVDLLRDHLAAAPPEAEEIAVGLLVIAHEAFRLAFGDDRIAPATARDVGAALADPGAGDEPQPALAAYHEEILDEAVAAAADPLPASARPLVAQALRGVRVALTGAVR